MPEHVRQREAPGDAGTAPAQRNLRVFGAGAGDSPARFNSAESDILQTGGLT